MKKEYKNEDITNHWDQSKCIHAGVCVRSLPNVYNPKGSPEEVAEKILRHSKALGGISRFTFQMDVNIPHKKLMESIELIGSKVSPLVKDRICNEF